MNKEKDIKKNKEIGIFEIMKLLPHRYPFLMVDRIIEINQNKSAIGIKNVTINEPFFQGHFVKYPIMPGVLIIESMAQVSGIICTYTKNIKNNEQTAYITSINKCKFRNLVSPGDTLKIHVTRIRKRFNVFKFYCKALVDNTIMCESEINITLPK